MNCDKKLAYIATEDDGYHSAFFMAVDFSEPEAPREVSRARSSYSVAEQ